MTTFLIILGIVLWLFCGAFSYIYNYIRNYNYTADEIPITLLSSVIGPLGFLIWWGVFNEDKIIFKKRNKKNK